MAISVLGTSTVGASTTTPSTISFNCPAGTTLLVVFVGGFTSTSASVTWDSTGTAQAMTQVGLANMSSVSQTYAFALINPTTGTHTLQWSWAGGSQTQCVAMALGGTDTTSVAVAVPSANVVTAVAPASNTGGTIAGKSASGDLCIAAGSTPSATTTSMSATGSTNAFTATRIVGSYAPGATSVSWTYVQTSGRWTAISIDILVGSGAPAAYFPFPPSQIQIWDH